MPYKGRVRNGVVVLEKHAKLPEGTKVVVRLTNKRVIRKKIAKRKVKNLSRLAKMLLSHAGTAKGLPRDMARNHDHYLHGSPKK